MPPTANKARVGGDKGGKGSRVASQAVVIATGVSADGRREVLGCAVGDSGTQDFWTEFLRGLRERGLATVSGSLCRPPDYADGVADVLAGLGFWLGEVGIIRALRAKRAGCRGACIGRVCCSVVGFGPGLAP